MTFRTPFAFGLVFSIGFAGLAQADPNLIGGELAKPGQFPFVVMIAGGCTGTKVGPKEFLTAAHCFFGGPGEWRMPAKVRVSATEIPSPKNHSLTVKAVRLHPTWVENCRTHVCDGHDTGGSRDVPGKVDLAHVIVTEATPEIPSIGIEFAPLEKGAEVTFAGYGCSTVIGGSGYGKLRFAKNRIGGPELLRHPGSLYAKIADITAESNWITVANAMDKRAPALCPGDSGGPLLVRDGEAWKIAGIAGDYTFKGKYERNGSIPMTNLHTRLDDSSRHQVGKWLRAAE